MIYYLYLDRCFLRKLFCVKDSSNFNIEVVEYSIRKSDTRNNQIAVDPCMENFCERENEVRLSKDIPKQYKDTNFTKQKVGANYGLANSSTIETQRKYINIEDITEIKNNCFYHHLIEELKNQEIQNDKRIIYETGIITEYNDELKDVNIDKNSFFLINNKLIWINSELLDGSIELLSKMSCEVKVIGYEISCFNSSKKIIKAIAIYIE